MARPLVRAGVGATTGTTTGVGRQAIVAVEDIGSREGLGRGGRLLHRLVHVGGEGIGASGHLVVVGDAIAVAVDDLGRCRVADPTAADATQAAGRGTGTTVEWVAGQV